MSNLPTGELGLAQAIGYCALLGIFYILALRLVERLVLVPYFGFLFTVLLMFLPLAVRAIVAGAGILLITRAFQFGGELTALDVRVGAIAVGLGILIPITTPDWERLLEDRKEKTGSAGIPESLFGKRMLTIFSTVGDVVPALFQFSLSLSLVGYLVYVFFFSR